MSFTFVNGEGINLICLFTLLSKLYKPAVEFSPAASIESSVNMGFVFVVTQATGENTVAGFVQPYADNYRHSVGIKSLLQRHECGVEMEDLMQQVKT